MQKSQTPKKLEIKGYKRTQKDTNKNVRIPSCGAPNGNWTRDLSLTKAALYLLSYGSKSIAIIIY